MANAVEKNLYPRTIVLKPVSLGGVEYGEAPVSSAGSVYPGYLLEAANKTSWPNGEVKAHASAGGYCKVMVACESEVADNRFQPTVGGTIDDAIAAGQRCRYHVCVPGEWILVRLAAAATAVVIGDFLTSAGNGKVKKATSTDQRILKVEEAVDNSAGSSDAWVRASVI